jgi:predicted nucleic acid-binding protein
LSGRLQYLLDTNVLSETRKIRADARVLSFLSAAEPSAMYISVLTIGELRKGVAHKRRSDPDAARKIESWVEGLELSFADRILDINSAIAASWGELSAQHPRPVIDTLLAATALVHDLTLVTRNVSDVLDLPVKVIDPWQTS